MVHSSKEKQRVGFLVGFIVVFQVGFLKKLVFVLVGSN